VQVYLSKSVDNIIITYFANRVLTEVINMKERAKIGLALGAGSARGVAHIGVLQVLEEAGINIDYLTGTSMGSLIGSFYAAGMDLKRLEGLAYQMDWDLITDITVPLKGLLSGKKTKEFVQLLTKNKKFSELEVPFAVVAADIQSGEEVVIKEGLVADAVRGSVSIPGVYVPYQLGENLLVDGALLNSVPADVVKGLGADIIVGVDVGYDVQQGRVNNIFDVIVKAISMMEREIRKYKSIEADIMIRPEVGHIPSRALHRAEECVEAGRKAAQKELPRIKKEIGRWEAGCQSLG
jgi:NTE family protein